MMPLPPQVPRRGGGVSRRVAAALLRLLGWRIAGSVPDVAKCVVVAVDYGRREVRFLPLFTPTADLAADHAALAALFRGIEPKHKHRLSWPLREAPMAETD